jgi:outer membrane protein TolC
VPALVALLVAGFEHPVSASERLQVPPSQKASTDHPSRGGGGQPLAAAQAGMPAAPVRTLSVDDAVRLALEQNLDLQVERINPQIQDLAVADVRTFWTPNFISSLTADNADTPASGFLSGGQDKVHDAQVSTSVGLNQQLPWGGRYNFAWNSARATTSSIFTSFNPVLRSNLNFAVVQPLLRDFGIDAVRQQLLVSRKNREISDVQLRSTVVSTVRDVKNAYWDLVFARSSLDVQRQSLDLARESLRNNRTRVEVGTMAPIDIVEAEAEVARNEETVIVAEAEIQRAEDRLRSLVYDPKMPDFWNITIQPSDAATLRTQPIDVDAAVRNALDKRTDLARARRSLEARDIDIRYFRNQLLPQVNLEANYGLAGLGGTQLESFTGFPADGATRTILGRRSFGSVLGDIFSNDFPSWTVGVTVGYPIGTSSADVNLARAKLERGQMEAAIRNLELQAATEVRDLGRQVNTNLKRTEATRASRQLAERRLEAEQKKFTVGMSTSFIVFQAQRDLSTARNNELRAILDYNRSLVDFEAVQETALGGTGGSLIVSGSTVTSGSAATMATTTTTTSTQQQR